MTTVTPLTSDNPASPRDEETVDRNALETLTQGVLDTILQQGLAPAGNCEHAAGLLGDELHRRGHDARVAWGEYDHPCPDGHATTGHCWVIVDGLLADPTRSQFDDGPLVMDHDSLAAKPYMLHYSISAAHLEA